MSESTNKMQKVYDQFFDSLEVIINGDANGGPWMERAMRLANAANDRSSQVSLLQLIDWADVIESALECEEETDDDDDDFDDEDFDDDDDFEDDDDWDDESEDGDDY